MRDFPIFTTEWGVSSLILKEIPYRGVAYIRIRDCTEEDFAAHLEECAAFCRAAGAQRVFAAGHPMLESRPKACDILSMRTVAWVDPEKLEHLFPVTEETVSQWRGLYNDRMRAVDHACTLERRDEPSIVKSGGAYFVHQEGQLLGIGWMEDTKLLAVAAIQRGAGERVVHTMMSLVEGMQMELEVASTNQKAIALYRRIGMIETGILSSWYRV